MPSAEYDRAVTILTPPRVAYVEWEGGDSTQERVFEMRDEQTQELREVIEQTAARHFMNLELYEYPLPYNQIPSRKATRWIRESNMITAWNPPDQSIAYIYCCMRKNPLLTALLGYDKEGGTSEKYEILSTQYTRVFQKGMLIEEQNRTFIIPPTVEIPHAKATIEKALLYPYKF